MSAGSGMMKFVEKFPNQYFDVGIAEQHAITFAGGIATKGLKPIVAIYSTFLQRGYDQLIHDIALQNLNVVFAIDRAGLVGADGATHSGSFDLSFLRCIPNLVIMAPSDAQEMYKMLNTAFITEGPVCVRYPRRQSQQAEYQSSDVIEIGKAKIIKKGVKNAILSFGTTMQEALIAAEKINATLVDMRFIKPLDEKLIKELSLNHERLISIEDNVVSGGAGSAISECLQRNNIKTPLTILGLPDEFSEQGTQNELYALYGINSETIVNAAEK